MGLKGEMPVQEKGAFNLLAKMNVLVMTAGILFLAGLVIYEMILNRVQRPPQPVITSVAADPEGREKWTLAGPRAIQGTDYISIPLVSEKKGVAVSEKGLHSYGGGGYTPPSRNLLFLNRKTAEMKWLFKENRQLITEIEMLSAPKQYERDRKVAAILYRVVTNDSNGDKELTPADTADVAVSFPDGSHYTNLFGAVERVIGAMSVDDEGGLVLYQLMGRGYASLIAFKDLSVIVTREIPNSEKDDGAPGGGR